MLGRTAWKRNQEFGFEGFKFDTENSLLYLAIWRIGRGKMETSVNIFVYKEFFCKEQRNGTIVRGNIFKRIILLYTFMNFYSMTNISTTKDPGHVNE